MIKEFNVSDSKEVRLYGEHYAGKVYAKDFVIHEDDIEFGILECDDVITGPAPALETLDYNDRVYAGVVHIRAIKIRGQDECTETDV
ncbi:hypothetical protein MYO4S_00085 [Serratia phage 4S]|nr:hypothetical protein MYO4S_00085 [Serratia phage 4S]